MLFVSTGWKNKQEIQDRIEEVLQLVGMSNKGYKLPNELSGTGVQMCQQTVQAADSHRRCRCIGGQRPAFENAHPARPLPAEVGVRK